MLEANEPTEAQAPVEFKAKAPTEAPTETNAHTELDASIDVLDVLLVNQEMKKISSYSEEEFWTRELQTVLQFGQFGILELLVAAAGHGQPAEQIVLNTIAYKHMNARKACRIVET